ncbi:MAG: DEAD/DEAH box helicase [Pseudomonadota bacterium]
MRAGVDIIVATPGRLLDHMNTGAITLDWTETVVLDEADQMMDLGFLPAIRKIMQSLPQDRSTALFSATMPKEIRRLANDFLDNPVEVAVAAVSKPIERIEQSVRLVDRNQKRDLLTELVSEKDVERAVVFTRTKRGADRVCRHLKDAGLNVAAIHGDKTQAQRDRALKQFKDGRVAILVATDIAARGIDIDGVSHVFNFDLPEVPEAYVHRIGRTARAGRSGVAISLCDASERHLLRAIEKLTGSRIEGGPEEAGVAAVQGGEANDNQRDDRRTKRHRRGRPIRQKAKGQSDKQKTQETGKQAHLSDERNSKPAKPRRRTRRPGGKPRFKKAAA